MDSMISILLLREDDGSQRFYTAWPHNSDDQTSATIKTGLKYLDANPPVGWSHHLFEWAKKDDSGIPSSENRNTACEFAWRGFGWRCWVGSLPPSPPCSAHRSGSTRCKGRDGGRAPVPVRPRRSKRRRLISPISGGRGRASAGC